MKMFVIGPTASGKTTFSSSFAKENSLRHIDCDKEFVPAPITSPFSYEEYPNEVKFKIYSGGVRRFLDSCGTDYVMDNIPFDPTWDAFNQWYKTGDVEVCCVVPESKQEWMGRKSDGGHKLNDEHWSYFWLHMFPMLSVPVSYLCSGREISHKDAMERIGMDCLIRDYIRSSDYDYRYQDIEEIGHRGYSGTSESWERIRNLVDWTESSVVDCGSFHGYLLFRAGDCGCEQRRIGLDFLKPALIASRAINSLREDTVEFRSWNAGETLPKSDVVLCMNALHHFPDASHPLGTHCSTRCSIERFLETIKAPVVIFEAYTKYEKHLKRYWSVERFPSGRKDRAIYLCR